MGRGSNDASAWLSPIWKKLISTTLPDREEGLQKFAQENGYEYYPWIAKTESAGGSGNQAMYFLEARKLNIGSSPSLALGDIRYIPVINIKPSWWAKLLFNQSASASGWRKWLYIFSPMFLIVIAAIFIYSLIIFLNIHNSPVTSRDIGYLLIALAMWVYARNEYDRFNRLIEDRIVMAPDSIVGYREFGVSLELEKPDVEDKNSLKVLRLVKYAAQCPVCDAEVLLDKGEPDFPRRIVGRCSESPREHVYSFDRVTKVGNRLR